MRFITAIAIGLLFSLATAQAETTTSVSSGNSKSERKVSGTSAGELEKQAGISSVSATTGRSIAAQAGHYFGSHVSRGA